MKNNPFKALDSYEEKDSESFFGREKESTLLSKKIEQQVVMLLYGKSGVGKSSLINAGIKPLVRKNFLPITIRTQNLIDTNDLTAVLIDLIRSAVEECGCTVASLIDEQVERRSVWEYLKSHEFLKAGEPITPLLIFDQFEEIFHNGRGKNGVYKPAVSELIQSLGVLAADYAPDELVDSERYDHYLDLDDFTNYRLLLAAREEYIPDLESLVPIIPALGSSSNRFRLDSFNYAQARLILDRAGSDFFDDEVKLVLLDKIAGIEVSDENADLDRSKVYLEPFLFSLFCFELVDGIDEGKKVKLANISERDFNYFIRRFYTNATKDISEKTKIFIEDNLLTEQSGMRNLFSYNDAVADNPEREKELSLLIDRKILRRPFFSGQPYLEIVHDRLINVVKSRRDKRELQQKTDMAREAAKKANAKRWSRARNFSIVFVGAIIGLASFLVYQGEVRHAQEKKELELELKNVENQEIKKILEELQAANTSLSVWTTARKLHEQGEKFRAKAGNLVKPDPSRYRWNQRQRESQYDKREKKDGYDYNREAFLKDSAKYSTSLQSLTDSAVNNYERALRMDPNLYSTYKVLCALYLEIGKYDLGLKTYQRSGEYIKDVNLGYQVFKFLNVLDKRIRYDGANTEEVLRWKTTFLMKADSLESSDPEFKTQLAQSFLDIAIYYSELAMIDQAMMLLKKAASMDPQNPDVFHNMGIIQQDAGNYAAAKKAFQEYDRLVGQTAHSQYDLALIYTYLKEYTSAISSYKRIIQIDEDEYSQSTTYQALANAFLERNGQGDADSAYKYYSMYYGALDESEFSEYVYDDIASSFMDQGKSELAFTVYERGINQIPESHLLENNYAWFLAVGNGDLNKALSLSQSSLMKRPDYDLYMDTLAEIYFLLGAYQEADSVNQLALSLTLDEDIIAGLDERDIRIKNALGQ
ncbi:MAG: hypothetical protein ABJ004_13890 [Cyclobacteriaceae bacterium]